MTFVRDNEKTALEKEYTVARVGKLLLMVEEKDFFMMQKVLESKDLSLMMIRNYAKQPPGLFARPPKTPYDSQG